jgi:7,8-dihydropterin-6-yl-methyl-4-(beta-D-ribofuranosyl)aminobenzene 5'-phosphate synthase
MMETNIKEANKIEVQTLQDNYVDFFAFKENNQTVQRPVPVKRTGRGLELSQPPGAEHGWSSLITVYNEETTKQLLFDFGWSEQGAARNADLLGLDLTKIDLMALSHGHIDHFGGIKALYDRTNNPGVDLLLHPAAFRNPRYGKIMGGGLLHQPCLDREMLSVAGIRVKETETPLPVLEETCLFLTGIERKTPFEKGMPDVYYRDGDEEKPDLIDDDSAIVLNLR